MKCFWHISHTLERTAFALLLFFGGSANRQQNNPNQSGVSWVHNALKMNLNSLQSYSYSYSTVNLMNRLP